MADCPKAPDILQLSIGFNSVKRDYISRLLELAKIDILLLQEHWLSDTQMNVLNDVGADFLPRCKQCRRGLAMRILSVRPSVRPSVCLSVKRVICDKMEERSVQIFIPYERSFSLVF